MHRSANVFIVLLTLILGLAYAYTVGRMDVGRVAQVVLTLPFVLVWIIPVVYWGRRRTSRESADHLVQYAGFLSMGWLSFLLVATVFLDLAKLVTVIFGATSARTQLDLYGTPVLLLLALIAFALGTIFARSGPSIREIEVRLADLPKGLDGFRIAQISDLHVGPTIKKAYVQRVVGMTNALKVDMVALTGDIIDGPLAELADDAAPLAGLEPKGRIFFITGNHEYYAGSAAEWLTYFKEFGFQVLGNSHVVVPHNDALLMVAGVWDAAARMSGGTGPDMQAALSQRDAGPDGLKAFRLLLAHNPKLTAAAATAGFQLQLSGHTHAGQFFPWTIVAKLVHRPHFAGLSREGGLTVYVSAGTGTWGPPIRLGTRPEITLLTLRSV